jgi:thiol-disulfide isomerase/thioredoxin
LGLAAASLLATQAWAEGTVSYSPGVIKDALAAGKTVFVDYSASWCSTCKTQERRINSLRKANPEYDANILFVKVDWDTYRSQTVTTSRKIPRRSTLVMLRGNTELGRLVAVTRKAEIKQLLDLGLTNDET